MEKSLSHTVWEYKCHIVCPKNIHKVIYGDLREELGQILRRLCEYNGVEPIQGTLCTDHIHLCLSIPPKYSVATIVGYLKGKSAMMIFEQFSRLKRNFKGHSFWARAYYVNTIGLDEPRSGGTSKTSRRLTPSKISMIMIRLTLFRGASTTC